MHTFTHAIKHTLTFLSKNAYFDHFRQMLAKIHDFFFFLEYTYLDKTS